MKNRKINTEDTWLLSKKQIKNYYYNSFVDVPSDFIINHSFLDEDFRENFPEQIAMFCMNGSVIYFVTHDNFSIIKQLQFEVFEDGSICIAKEASQNEGSPFLPTGEYSKILGLTVSNKHLFALCVDDTSQGVVKIYQWNISPNDVVSGLIPPKVITFDFETNIDCNYDYSQIDFMILNSSDSSRQFFLLNDLENSIAFILNCSFRNLTIEVEEPKKLLDYLERNEPDSFCLTAGETEEANRLVIWGINKITNILFKYEHSLSKKEQSKLFILTYKKETWINEIFSNTTKIAFIKIDNPFKLLQKGKQEKTSRLNVGFFYQRKNGSLVTMKFFDSDFDNPDNLEFSILIGNEDEKELSKPAPAFSNKAIYSLDTIQFYDNIYVIIGDSKDGFWEFIKFPKISELAKKKKKEHLRSYHASTFMS